MNECNVYYYQIHTKILILIFKTHQLMPLNLHKEMILHVKMFQMVNRIINNNDISIKFK